MTTEPTEFTFTSPSNCYAIARTDSCVRHPSVAWTVACSGCIKDALVQEYERGKKASPPEAESETIKELRRQLSQEQEAAFKYWKEKRDMEKDYATLKQYHEKAREQIAIANRIVNGLRLNALYSPSLQQALKEWEAL